jgi:hypothetical protein
MYVHMNECMYVCMYVYMYVCMYVCMYVYMYACMYACMHVRMYVCVCYNSAIGANIIQAKFIAPTILRQLKMNLPQHLTPLLKLLYY